MRTTPELELDVLLQARQIAQMQRASTGKNVSRVLGEHFSRPSNQKKRPMRTALFTATALPCYPAEAKSLLSSMFSA